MTIVVVWKKDAIEQRVGDQMAGSLDGQAMLDGRNVSAGARAALRSAATGLTPFADEPRIEALIEKLQSIADPVSKSEGVVRLSKSDQLKHLREMSPAAAAAAEGRSA